MKIYTNCKDCGGHTRPEGITKEGFVLVDNVDKLFSIENHLEVINTLQVNILERTKKNIKRRRLWRCDCE